MAWVLAFLCLRRGVSTDSVSTLAKWILFSAYAEVFPAITVGTAFSAAFSLPTQRCFEKQSILRYLQPLFSAYAEVFPLIRTPQSIRHTFLCLRRGVSLLDPRDQSFGVLFSAYAEVFLVLLLSPLCGANFSLPTQRCFSFTLHSPRSVGLFSAYAEVFLYAVIRASSSVSFLCLRRGVSRGLLQFELERGFSLPTQRCFYRS